VRRGRVKGSYIDELIGMAMVLNVQKGNSYKGLISPPPASTRLCIQWETMMNQEEGAKREARTYKIVAGVLAGVAGMAIIIIVVLIWRLNR
jgi:hypothetical protein